MDALALLIVLVALLGAFGPRSGQRRTIRPAPPTKPPAPPAPPPPTRRTVYHGPLDTVPPEWRPQIAAMITEEMERAAKRGRMC